MMKTHSIVFRRDELILSYLNEIVYNKIQYLKLLFKVPPNQSVFDTDLSLRILTYLNLITSENFFKEIRVKFDINF